jgi:hypothetical protein
MSDQDRIIIIGRTDSVARGFQRVHAQVANGVTGEYEIANGLVGTDAELEEIRAQSARRAEAIDQTRPGQS